MQTDKLENETYEVHFDVNATSEDLEIAMFKAMRSVDDPHIQAKHCALVALEYTSMLLRKHTK